MMTELNTILASTIGRVLITILIALIAQYLSKYLINPFVNYILKIDKRDSEEEYSKRKDTLTSVFGTIFAISLWVFTVVIVLWELHINIGAVATGAGLLGIIIGFGVQSSIKDFLAGIFIISENQYRVSDYVKLQTDGGEISGTVEDITIRITRLRDMEGTLHTVPNGSILLASNLTIDFANIWMDLSVDYDSDLKKVEKVINKVGSDMVSIDKFSDSIVEPIRFWRVNGFEQSAVLVKVKGTVKPGTQWSVAGEFRKSLKQAFDENKLSMSSMNVVVHNSNEK